MLRARSRDTCQTSLRMSHRTKKACAVRQSRRANSPSAGGVGSSIGNVYQKKVAAWWLTRVLTQNTTIGAAFGLSAGIPIPTSVAIQRPPASRPRAPVPIPTSATIQRPQTASFGRRPPCHLRSGPLQPRTPTSASWLLHPFRAPHPLRASLPFGCAPSAGASVRRLR
jgi:hypothetical protein